MRYLGASVVIWIAVMIVALSRHPVSLTSLTRCFIVPCSLSIPSKVCSLGMFRNSIPVLAIFNRRLLTTPADPRPETRCNRRARPKDKFRLHSRLSALTCLCVLFSYSSIPYILQVSLYISQSTYTTYNIYSIGRRCRSRIIGEFGTRPT